MNRYFIEKLLKRVGVFSLFMFCFNFMLCYFLSAKFDNMVLFTMPFVLIMFVSYSGVCISRILFSGGKYGSDIIGKKVVYMKQYRQYKQYKKYIFDDFKNNSAC